MKKVIYTAIFGDYDSLPEPDYIPNGFDFICFTDTDIKSNIWKIKKALPLTITTVMIYMISFYYLNNFFFSFMTIMSVLQKIQVT